FELRRREAVPARRRSASLPSAPTGVFDRVIERQLMAFGIGTLEGVIALVRPQALDRRVVPAPLERRPDPLGTLVGGIEGAPQPRGERRVLGDQRDRLKAPGRPLWPVVV